MSAARIGGARPAQRRQPPRSSQNTPGIASSSHSPEVSPHRRGYGWRVVRRYNLSRCRPFGVVARRGAEAAAVVLVSCLMRAASRATVPDQAIAHHPRRP